MRPAASQWSTVYEQFYLQAPHNFAFRRTYQAADRLFNAFDYGHAILYEVLLTQPNRAVERLESREYDFLTERLLGVPPRLPAAEDAIEPMYSRLAPEAKMMFEWAHLLHRQAYDILADARLTRVEQDSAMALLESYYFSRRDLAFSRRPKTMALMQEQPYSLAFRTNYPKFNGLIWAYHSAGGALRAADRRHECGGAARGHNRHGRSVSADDDRWPGQLSGADADDWGDRAEILKAASAYRDDTTEVVTVEGWRKITTMMGLQNMGGPAVGFLPALPALPTPTVPRGFVMRHDKDGNPIGEHDHHEP